jgi:tripartite-type tricarboxylate transporter receptor subunit TctC
MLNRRLSIKWLSASSALAVVAGSRVAIAQSQSQPAIRILVGAPAGGSTDTMARAIASDMGKALGRTIVVENKPGAGGNIAADAVAKAVPDGNTLLMSFTSHAINASLYPSLPFHPVNDFTPLTCVSTSPSMLVIHPSVNAKDLNSFITLVRANPGKFNFAIGALGSSLHMAGDAFKMQANLFIVNVPYRGTAPAVSDVLAGQVEAMFAAVGNVQQHVKAGKLRAIGVTSAARLSAFPDVPAIGEVLKGFESSAWFGLFGPARMSADLTLKIGDAARAALRVPEVRRRLETEGALAVGNSSQEFAVFVQSEISRWAKVVKYSGAKPE